jgi:hypothetical protein
MTQDALRLNYEIRRVHAAVVTEEPKVTHQTRFVSKLQNTIRLK